MEPETKIQESNHAKSIQAKLRVILDKVKTKGIIMSRVPANTKKKFIDLANKEFCGDYGLCLKFLVDDLISKDDRMIIEAITQLEARVISLEQGMVPKKEQNEENKEVIKRMVNGQNRRIRKCRTN